MTENEKKVTKKRPKKIVSGLPPFAYPLLPTPFCGTLTSYASMAVTPTDAAAAAAAAADMGH